MRFTGFWLQRTPHWILKSFESRWILTFKSPWILTVENAMGWLRLVGSLKLQVSYAEYSLFNRALLQKRRRIWSSLLIVATAYSICHVQWLWGLHSVFQAFWPGISRHYQGAQEELFAIQIDSQCSTHCSIYLLIRLQADLRESYNYVCIIYIYIYMYICTYICIYIYMYICTYICIRFSQRPVISLDYWVAPAEHDANPKNSQKTVHCCIYPTIRLHADFREFWPLISRDYGAPSEYFANQTNPQKIVAKSTL